MCNDIINSLYKRKGSHTELICTSMVNFTGQSKAEPRSDLREEDLGLNKG